MLVKTDVTKLALPSILQLSEAAGAMVLTAWL